MKVNFIFLNVIIFLNALSDIFPIKNINSYISKNY